MTQALSPAAASPQRLSAADAPSMQACGLPLAPEIAHAAVQWFVRFGAGEVNAQERRQWQDWHDAHADHARAWQHLSAVTQALPGLNPGGAAYHGLVAAPRARRRQLLGLAATLVIAGPAGWMTWQQQPWQPWQADYASATGERRRFTLPDGTQLVLGTASRAALHYDGTQRRVHLLAGEAWFRTAHPGGPMGALPFVVETAHGRIRALGTQFSVRLVGDESRVAVLEGAVELTPRQGAPLRVAAGQAATLRADGSGPLRPAAPGDTAWSQGLLIVDKQRLDDFLAELGRYRSGWLRADPAVAGLRLSGVFPLGPQADTDAVLALLPNSLPVQVRLRSRWWVVVEPQTQAL